MWEGPATSSVRGVGESVSDMVGGVTYTNASEVDNDGRFQG